MEQAPENSAGVSAAPEARAAPKYAAPDQKTISRAFTLDPPAFHLTRLDAPTAPKLVIKIANELLWWAGILACNFCWACCCCRNLQTEVRAILMLTTIETCAAVAYAINLLVTALGTDAEVETSVYYIALMLIVLSFMLWVFVLSSIRRENVYELLAANLLSAMLCLTPALLAIAPSDRLLVETTSFNLTLDDGASRAKRIAAETWKESVEIRRAVFVSFAVLSGVAFSIMSLRVRREFGWRLFMLYGSDELKKKLYPKLMLFWALWKVDMMWGLLTLVATWAFLYAGKEWQTSERFGVAAGVLSNVGCDLVVAVGVSTERRLLTFSTLLVGAVQPTYLIYTMTDVFRQVFEYKTEKYADVWLTALMPTLICATLARISLLCVVLQLVLKVFDRGMKGKDPYIKEVVLPDGIMSRLSTQPKLIEMLKALVVGQLVELAVEPEPPMVDGEHLRKPRVLKSRFVQMSADLSTLRWSWKDYMLIDQILQMGRCQAARLEERQISLDLELDNWQGRFWIMYRSGGKRHVMQMQCVNPEQMEVWYRGIEVVFHLNPDPFPGTHMKQWLIDVFQAADGDHSGIVDKDELPLLISAANKSVRREWIEQAMVDDDDGALNFVEVQRLMLELIRDNEHVTSLFKRYAKAWRKVRQAQELMTAEEWLVFQREEQEDFDEKHSLQVFEKLREAAAPPSLPPAVAKRKPPQSAAAAAGISLETFQHYLLSDANSALDPMRTALQPERMTHPLAHYWIFSSHNSYLTGNQLTSDSSADMYRRICLSGCRCVEMDCWDADDGEPMIYHGFTVTSKIKVKDVLKAIAETAFVTTPLPLTLSLEMHCSLPQQHRIAQLIKKYFQNIKYSHPDQDKGGVEPPATGCSPLDMHHCIMVKGKVMQHFAGGVCDEDEGEGEEEDTEERVLQLLKDEEYHNVLDQGQEGVNKVKRRNKKMLQVVGLKRSDTAQQLQLERLDSLDEAPAGMAGRVKRRSLSRPSSESESEGEGGKKKKKEKKKKDKKKKDKGKKDKGGSSESEDGEGKKKKKKEKKHKVHKVDPALAELTFLSAIKNKSFVAGSGQCSAYEMSSFGENRCLKLLQLKDKVAPVYKGHPHSHLFTFASLAPHAKSLEGYASWQVHNTRQISRVYPKGTRVMSDNLDPLPHWCAGSQMVAMNMQTNDLPMQLNSALFQLDGGFGYILKPEEMRRPEAPPPSLSKPSTSTLPGASPPEMAAAASLSPALDLGEDRPRPSLSSSSSPAPPWPPAREQLHHTTLTVHSLHFLPTRKEFRPEYALHEKFVPASPTIGKNALPVQTQAGNVSSPIIAVELHAIGGVCSVSTELPPPAGLEMRVATQAVERNGLNPRYNTKVHCVAAEPMATILRLVVIDDEKEVAYETVVLGALRRGWRALPMRAMRGCRIDFCCVLIHVAEGTVPVSVLKPRVERKLAGKKEGVQRTLELRDMRMARWQRTRDMLRGLVRLADVRLICSAIEATSLQPETQLKGCAALSNMACHHRGNAIIIGQAGGVLQLCAVMAQQADHARLQEGALRALANLLCEPSCVVLFLGHEGVERLCDAMLTHEAVAAVQLEGCRAIANMTKEHEGSGDLLLAAGAAPLITAAMEAHPHAIGVQREACAALANLSKEVDSEQSVLDAGGVERIISSMRRHSDVARIAEEGMAALARLGLHNEEARARQHAEGAVALVRSTLDHFAASPDVLTQACWHVSGLAREGVREVRELLVSELLEKTTGKPAPLLIAAAMRRHPHHQALVEAGCSAVWALAASPEDAATLTDLGLVSVLCHAMALHQQSAHVQRAACEALAALCGAGQAAQQEAVEGGAVALVCAAMECDVGLVYLQTAGCRALALLATDSKGRDAAAAVGAAELICAAMEEHWESPQLNESACLALAAMAKNRADTQRDVAVAGGLEMVLMAMEEHTGRDVVARSVQAAACAAIASLAADKENAVVLASERAAERVCEAMEEHVRSAALQREACRSLEALASASPVSSATLREAHALAVVCVSMLNHAKDASVLSAGVGALAGMLRFDPHASLAEVHECGGVKLVDNALATHVTSVPLQASGCEFYARVAAVMGEAQGQGGRPVRPLQFLGPARLQLIIAAMQIERHANAKSSKLQAFASRSLALVARDSEAGAAAVLDADAVEPLVHALALYMDLPQLRAEVLNAFSALTCTPRGRTMITAGNGLQRLAAAMKIDAASEACEWGCSTFANLACGTGEQKRAIAAVGAVGAICAAMEAQRHRTDLQECGCRALANLASERSLVRPVQTAGGVERVCVALQMHPDYPAVQEEGCAFVANVAFDGREGRQELVRLGCCQLLTRALASHQSRHAVLQEACAALANLSQDELAAKELSKLGGGKLVAKAMADHQTDERLQMFGVAALDNLSYTGLAPLEHNASHLGDVAGSSPLSMASRVAIAMKTHPTEKMLELGCRAMANLAQEGEACRRSVVKAGGAALVCRAMQNHPSSAQLQRRGCAAMANLAGDEAFDVVAQGDGIGRVAEAMATHLADAAVQVEGCSAVANLACADRKTRLALMKAGGPQLVCRAMERHLSDESVQQEGCAALANLCWGEVQKQEVQTAGGTACIFAAVRAHPKCAGVAEWACKALHNLACNNDAMRASLLKQSSIELVCSMLKDHPDSSGVQLEGCITLASLAKADEGVKQLISRAGGPSLVQAAMQRHKKCADLQRWGHKGLLAITPSDDYNAATQKYELRYAQ